MNIFTITSIILNTVIEILQLTNIDFVARAPEGKEVEELTKKEIFKSLRDKTTIEQFKPEIKKDLSERTKGKISEVLDKMVGTRAAYIFDDSMKLLGKIPLTQFSEDNKRLHKAKIVVIDGKINNSILGVAELHSIEFLAANSADKKLKPHLIKIFTKDELSN